MSTDKKLEEFPYFRARPDLDVKCQDKKRPIELPVYIGRVRDQDSDERDDSMSSVGEDDNLFRGKIRNQMSPLNKNVLEESKNESYQRIEVVELSQINKHRSNFNNFSFKTSFFNVNDI